MKNHFYALLMLASLTALCGTGCEVIECLTNLPPEYEVTELDAPAKARVNQPVKVTCTIEYGEGERDCSDVFVDAVEAVTVFVDYSYSQTYCGVEAACFITYNTESGSPAAGPGTPRQTDEMWYTPQKPGVYCTRVTVMRGPAVVSDKAVFTEVDY